ncbi:undecaprenyl-diphosphate phosphatase [Paenibacillus sp. J5C_2022]|uniref:undecaprenyl-diphosphate phosphatase n=1 Tax=Paenibacillus sp. J5C2022 TaxID=2977129 RepID=UPI0021D3236D|nr:undecaprenyl-diphosphate phosphatase [Paenibacillus sp. J5C2022]MCU6712358.1 undecaprenyl-diphosphate phosphatase [Paenibacillus sp. J5C2022]
MDELILWLKYVFLGIVQGFTEPIPISSSGHLIIVQRLLGMEQKGLSFEMFANTASFLAIVFIYRKLISRLFLNGLSYIRTRKPEHRSDFMFIVYVVVGTIPAVVIGLLFEDWIAEVLTNVRTVAISLLVTGGALWLIRNMKGIKREGDLSVKDAFLVGLAQAVAIIPGISRSGATVIASLAVGMKQETALRFSFMLYIPISLGGLVLGFSDLSSDPAISSLIMPYVLAFVATMIMTYISMKWLMDIMEKGNLKYFAYYCFVAGVLLLIFL